jgi:hypothetical protein
VVLNYGGDYYLGKKPEELVPLFLPDFLSGGSRL